MEHVLVGEIEIQQVQSGQSITKCATPVSKSATRGQGPNPPLHVSDELWRTLLT